MSFLVIIIYNYYIDIKGNQEENMDIKDLMKIQSEFDLKHTGNFNWNEKITDNNIEILEFLFISIFGEVGEAANLVKKSVRGDYKLDYIKEDLSEEITDIFIYLMKLCNQLDIDLEECYMKKLEKNIVRFKKYEDGGE